MKKKFSTFIIVLIVLATAAACTYLYLTNCDLKTEIGELKSAITTMQEENQTTAETANQCKLETEEFMHNCMNSLEELETRYQNLYTLMEKEETEEPVETAETTPEESIPMWWGATSNSLCISGNFDDQAEMMQTLASFGIDEIQQAIKDYGFFVGQSENPEHYIVITPVPAS